MSALVGWYSHRHIWDYIQSYSPRETLLHVNLCAERCLSTLSNTSMAFIANAGCSGWSMNVLLHTVFLWLWAVLSDTQWWNIEQRKRWICLFGPGILPVSTGSLSSQDILLYQTDVTAPPNSFCPKSMNSRSYWIAIWLTLCNYLFSNIKLSILSSHKDFTIPNILVAFNYIV